MFEGLGLSKIILLKEIAVDINCIFHQINTPLFNIRDLFQQH